MPVTALDILPPRTEVSSLSGSDAGVKTQGTSSGKNEGPSFSEILEKTAQKDTTDGKITESDSVAQETVESTEPQEAKVADVEVPAEEKPVLAETGKALSFENQIFKSEDLISSKEPVLQEASFIAEEVMPVMADETVPEVDVSENVTEVASKQVVSKKEAPVEVSDDAAPVPVEQKELPVDVRVASNTEKNVGKKEEPQKNRASSAENTRTENVATLKAAENVPEEKREVKKEKKSRFSEYDYIMAGLANKAEGKVSPSVLQQSPVVEANVALASGAENPALSGEKIQIVDLRTGQETPEKTDSEGFVKHVSFDDKGNAQVSLSLMPSKETSASAEAVDGIAKKDFSAMLSRELESSAGELVKTGSIVLQNNNKGSINLILHPEQLGNVKIKLELSENQISGKIVVASQEAFDAFKESISAIKEAFAASGFEAGGFELAWSGNGSGGNHDQRQEQQFVQERTVNEHGMKYVDSMPDIASVEYSSNGNVNLVA